jgi:hypothetical protein
MLKRSALFPVLALSLLALSACSDSDSAMLSAPPPPPFRPLGTIFGRVEGSKVTMDFVPAGGLVTTSGNVSPAIYGSGGTVAIAGVVDSQPVYVVGDSTKWFIKVHMRNLLTNKIGTNYPGTPTDSAGVFLFFTSNPAISLPAGCGCTVTIKNPAGVGNFTAPTQSYYWYNSIPTAVQGSPGTDTTANQVWVFKANKAIAHAFFFTLEVSAMWPPPAEGTWSVAYNGLTDSLPLTLAEPRWRGGHFRGGGGATVTWSASGLLMAANGNTRDTVMFRRDSLGTMAAYMDVTFTINSGAPGRTVAAFGFSEPVGGGRKLFAVEATANRISFGQISAGGVWSQLGLTSTSLSAGPHVVRLRKVAGAVPQMEICLDGTLAIIRAYANLQTAPALLTGISEFFAVQGRNGGASVTYTSVAYTVGSDASGCL